MTAEKIKNMKAIQNAVDTNNFIGYLMWFSISECRIRRLALEEIFTKHGLPENKLPGPIWPRDAFRRATKAGEVKDYILSTDPNSPDYGKKLNLLVREVKTDGNAVIRQIVREIVDSKNVRLEYEPVAEVRLVEDRLEWNSMVVSPGIERESLAKIAKAYDMDKECYNGQHMRQVIWGILGTCSPLTVRPSGGVYFLPAAYEATMKKVQALVSDLNYYGVNGGKSALWSVPVIDEAEQREMLQTSLEDQVKSEANWLLQEMGKAKATGKPITQKQAQKFVEQTRALSKMVREYEDALELEVTTAKVKLETATTQALALLGSVDNNPFE